MEASNGPKHKLGYEAKKKKNSFHFRLWQRGKLTSEFAEMPLNWNFPSLWKQLLVKWEL
jgi:hypothetical protein